MTSLKKFVIATALSAGTAVFLHATPGDLTGVWDGEMTGDSGQSVHIQFQLKQTGERVTGTAGPATEAGASIYDASIQGDHLRFSVGQDPRQPTWKFDLNVSNKEMRGKAEGANSGESLGATSVSMHLHNSH